VPVILWTFKI